MKAGDHFQSENKLGHKYNYEYIKSLGGIWHEIQDRDDGFIFNVEDQWFKERKITMQEKPA